MLFTRRSQISHFFYWFSTSVRLSKPQDVSTQPVREHTRVCVRVQRRCGCVSMSSGLVGDEGN